MALFTGMTRSSFASFVTSGNNSSCLWDFPKFIDDSDNFVIDISIYI